MKTFQRSRQARDRLLIASSTILALALTLSCGDEVADPVGNPVAPQARRGSADLASAVVSEKQLVQPDNVGVQNLTLPYSGSVNSSSAGFLVTQRGAGRAGIFAVNNASSTANALQASSSGKGATIYSWTTGTGMAGLFTISNTGSNSPALEAITNGHAEAGYFRSSNPVNGRPSLYAETVGSGPALSVNYGGPSPGDIAVFQSGSANQVRFNKNGKGFFNGGTQTGGADVAEAFEVEGRASNYEPGDVLVISARNNLRVEKSSEAYSTRVIGVYATKPGVLLTERNIDASLDDMVPLGVMGVIPTKVSAENGKIRRGDLLVTARTPGHAMRATPITVNGFKLYAIGSSLGKALEEFTGPGTGVIKVLVSLR